HAENRECARQFIIDIKKQHPQARHHCWAYIAGAPDDSSVMGFSDDGEPAGTAGKPILAKLQGSQLGEIIAVVVRYYGGILLGTGGLVRAYSHGVQQALSQLTVQQRQPGDIYQLQCDYSLVNQLEYFITNLQGEIREKQFTQHVLLVVWIPAIAQEIFKQQLALWQLAIKTQ